jgi:hypothetical protein
LSVASFFLFWFYYRRCLLISASPRAFDRTRKGGEATPGSLPHAHQPRDARVRLPGLRHADGDPLHGRSRVRRPPANDFEVLLPTAPIERTTSPRRTARIDARTRRRSLEGNEERRLEEVQ